MENNKFEKTIFTILRVFGVLSIVGAYLDSDGLFSEEGLVVIKGKTIVGNIYMLSPKVMIGMIVSIILYLIFLKIIARYISISKRSIK